MKAPDWLKNITGDYETKVPPDYYSARELSHVLECSVCTIKPKLDDAVNRGELNKIIIKQGRVFVSFYGKKKTKNR